MLLHYFSIPALAACLLFPLLSAAATPPVAKSTTPKPVPVKKQQAEKQNTDPALSEIRALADSGAGRLAVYSLGRYQDASKDVASWMEWEKERIRIMQGNQDWRGINARLAKLPQGVSDNFVRWAMTQQVDASIRLKDGNTALALLQQLIWNLPPDHPQLEQWLQEWRHLVLDAYLAKDAVDDAHLAASHYYRDYGASSTEERLLRARILLSAGWADEAVSLLKQEKESAMASVLLLLAELRSERRSAKTVLNTAFRQLRGKPSADIKLMLWAIVAESAAKVADRGSLANALEHIMAAEENLPNGLFHYRADDLWQAYFDYARAIGNKSQFLIGQDAPWFKSASAVKLKHPVRSRSLLAFLIVNGESTASRGKAVDEFLTSMKGRKNGGRVLQALFLHTKAYPKLESVPLAARYLLVDVALHQSDLELASSLMRTIQTPPDGADRFFWELRRARIFVMGGDHAQGAQALESILKSAETLTSEQVDQFLQVVFDLQTVQAHAEAYRILKSVLPLKHDEKRLRELYYWMAESSKAMKEHAEAARLYLKSAMLPEVTTMDPWAQTARYQAASSLAKAGMVKDARRLLEQLLRVTQDPGRRSVLRHELQKLWLLQEVDSVQQPGELKNQSAMK